MEGCISYTYIIMNPAWNLGEKVALFGETYENKITLTQKFFEKCVDRNAVNTWDGELITQNTKVLG